MAGVLPNNPVPKPKLGVVLPNKLGADVVVVPNVEPKSGAEVVVVVPNKLGVDVGAPNKLVVCVLVPNRLVLVATGVENRLGALVAPNRLGFVVVEPKSKNEE